MAWVDIPTFKANFAIAKNASESQAQMALDAAVDEVIELVGQAAVDDSQANSLTDAVRAARIVRAHQFLAAAIHCLNVRNVKKEQSDQSAGMGSNNVNNEFWTPKEIAEMRELWRGIVYKALGPYLVLDVPGDSYGAGVEYSHPAEVSCDVC